MKEFLFVTKNKAKFNRASKILKEYGILLKQHPMEILELRSMDIKEIATSKAKYAMSKLNKPFFVLDAGIYIKALNDFPGPYVEQMLKTFGIKGLLEIMKDKKDRNVEFKYVLVYIGFDKELHIFEGSESGIISENMRGENDRGWASSYIYIPFGFNKTLAEMSEEEYEEYERKIRPTDPFVKFAQWLTSEQNRII